MTKSKKSKAAPAAVDPAQKILERQRANMRRALLKRRRQKSGQ